MKKRQTDDEIKRREMEEGSEDLFLVVSLGLEADSQEELEVSNTEDEEGGCTPLIIACRKGMTEVTSLFEILPCVLV